MKIAWVLMLLSLTAYADSYYALDNVKRLDNNLYSGQNNGHTVIIQTQYCSELASGDDAILKYDPYSYDNKLIFVDDNESCDVKAVKVF